MDIRTAIQSNPFAQMTKCADSPSEPAGNRKTDPTPRRRTLRINVRVTAGEHLVLRRHAAVRGMKTAQYVRAAALGQRANSRAYAELAREVLAIGHSVMVEVPERGGERERLLALIRPVLRRINSHLP